MSTLPYDSRVEYLEKTTGREVIDTGLYATNNTTFYAVMMNIGTVAGAETNDYIAIGANIFGDNNQPRYGMCSNTSGNLYCMYNTTYKQASAPVNLNTKRIVEVQKSGNNFIYVVDNEEKATASVSSFTTPVTVTILGRNLGDGTYKGTQLTRLYSFRMYESGVIVRDMIPVRVGQVGYMYDRVSGQLFGNASSGSFALGNDIEEKTKIDLTNFRRRLMMSSAEDYDTYLTFEAIDAGQLKLHIGATNIGDSIGQISYSINNGEWKTKNYDTSLHYTFPQLNAGNKIRLKANAVILSNAAVDNYHTYFIFTAGSRFNIYGDLWSLYFGDNFKNSNEYTSDKYFQGLFYNCTGLVSAEHLQLKAPTLLTQTYSNMFEGCTNLVKAPKIHATTVGQYSCYSMFYGCTSLTDVPDLEITNFSGANACRSMFGNCTSLQKAPALPAISFPSSRQGYYLRMFNGCTSLNYIKSLHTNIDRSSYTNGNTYQWVQNVSSSGTFVKNINANWSVTGTSAVPSGWTILYFNPTTEKYYLSDKTTECDEYGNVI